MPAPTQTPLQTEQLVVLSNVTWATYKQLSADLGDNRATHLAFLHGNLEIMSPSRLHEQLAQFLTRIVILLAESFKQPIEACGAMRLEREDVAISAEPDGSFYLANEPRIRRKVALDFTVDPAPDLIIEIDISSGSLAKFAIYETFRIPEIWRYDERKGFMIYVLSEAGYAPTEQSSTFTEITRNEIQTLISECQKNGQTAAIKKFQSWLKLKKKQRKKSL